MTTPTLTSNMFKNTSHLGLSVPHTTAMTNVATGTETSKLTYKQPFNRVKNMIVRKRKKCSFSKHT